MIEEEMIKNCSKGNLWLLCFTT